MTGINCLTFVFVALCSYALSTSKPVRNEATKKLDIPQPQPNEHTQKIHTDHEMKTETRRKRSQLEMGGNGAVFGAGAGEYRDLSEFLEELGDNALLQTSMVPQSQEVIDIENMSPLVYYMLLQKMKEMQSQERQLPTRRTPRLGRSIDFQLFDAANPASSAINDNGAAISHPARDFNASNMLANDYAAISRQYLPHIMKKSVQFKPRLGKRAQVCD